MSSRMAFSARLISSDMPSSTTWHGIGASAGQRLALGQYVERGQAAAPAMTSKAFGVLLPFSTGRAP
jgi:hypothetical protein